MIARHRLRGRRRFAAVRAAGARASSGAVRVQLSLNALGVARVGFAIVGVPSSVRRNLLRRRLRDAVRPRLGALGGCDVVIVAGDEALALPFAALSSAVETTLTRAAERAESAAVASAADNGGVTRPAQADR